MVITEHSGEYTLRVKELILVVRSRDLEQAYRKIVARRRQIVRWAKKVGSLSELPLPCLPTLASALEPPRQGASTILREVEPASRNPPASYDHLGQ
ncbi:MAG TPA: hypothetical protein VEC60_01385 [Reyranella sp.]|nr:hypothetical protein [Reyranella sp.]